MTRVVRAVLILCAPMLLANCASVFDGGYEPYSGNYKRVTVERGDTVSEIATRYRVKQDDIVAINDLRDRDTLYAGQVLKLPPTAHRTSAPPQRIVRRADPPPARATNAAYEPQTSTPKKTDAVWWQNLSFDTGSSPDAQFLWPVKGTVISPYGGRANGERNDGINIAVPDGAPVLAAEAGTVTYVGNELKGYGNLVLIHHDNGYMTTYAHAEQIIVTRGQHVARGEIIAYVGASGGVAAPQLHFEIRRGTTPVDPKPLLIASR
jgi:murein DD-endopeptidase MepM/ murein hydrolase activator NlpD